MGDAKVQLSIRASWSTSQSSNYKPDDSWWLWTAHKIRFTRHIILLLWKYSVVTSLLLFIKMGN